MLMEGVRSFPDNKTGRQFKVENHLFEQGTTGRLHLGPDRGITLARDWVTVLRQDLTQWFQHVGVLKDLSPRHVQPFAVEDSITIQ